MYTEEEEGKKRVFGIEEEVKREAERRKEKRRNEERVKGM